MQNIITRIGNGLPANRNARAFLTIQQTNSISHIHVSNSTLRLVNIKFKVSYKFLYIFIPLAVRT